MARKIPIQKKSSKQTVTQRKRLTPDERRKQLLEGAISFFASEGFDGGTRDLAERMGVTQPLIYNYFPTKEDLIRDVYETVFVGRWRSEWTDLLSDRSVPLQDRLVRFYERYTEVIFSPDWIRIYLHAALKGFDINSKWVSFVEAHLLRLICNEIRHEHGFPTLKEVEISPVEIDTFWLFHGGIFYHGVRQELFQAQARLAHDQFIEISVSSMVLSMRKVLDGVSHDPGASP
ncbi:TetR/AcrR family transcriptional regulator [Pseudosulfitobacter sp. RP-4]